AAGIAGVIKTVLSLTEERIPRTLHAAELNPHIAWQDLPVHVARASVPWPRTAAPRRAAVSSFGFSGTNAHVILEEAPAIRAEVDDAANLTLEAQPLLVSAKTESALVAQASHYAEFLRAHPAASLASVAKAAALERTHFPHRAVVIARDTRDAIAG